MAGSSLGATPATASPDHQAATLAAIMDAQPRDLAELLTGAMLAHLSGADTYPRQCLKAAHAVLTGTAGNAAAALPYISAGLAHAIRPDQIERAPETVLLQAVYWLLATEAQVSDLLAALSAAGAAGRTAH
ncbi:MAG: hypothetical protein RLY71_1988 [Pseudomonadota bacterium]|jgi:hypothetical protein